MLSILRIYQFPPYLTSIKSLGLFFCLTTGIEERLDSITATPIPSGDPINKDEFYVPMYNFPLGPKF